MEFRRNWGLHTKTIGFMRFTFVNSLNLVCMQAIDLLILGDTAGPRVLRDKAGCGRY